MKYNNGLVYIEIKTKARFNRKNTEYLQKMMKKAVEEISDFIDLCVDLRMGDEYMPEVPSGLQVDGE